MNKRFVFAAAALLALPLMAHASCDDAKASIDGKLKAKGLSGYSLDVVSSDQADASGKVVGHCEGDKKIVYARGGDASDSGSSSDSSAPAAASSSETPAKPMHHHHVPKHPAAASSSDAPAQPAPASSSGG